MKLKQRVVLLAALLVVLILAKVFLLDGGEGSAASRQDQRAFQRMEAGLRLRRGAQLDHTLQSPWEVAAQWVGPREVYPDETPELGAVLSAMATGRVERADVGYKGTQLKALLVLEGGQKVVFKPRRYSRDHVVEGEPYAGYDRHNAEVAAFHLDRILGFRRAPLVVGRFMNLRTEIKPVATDQLLSTFLVQGEGAACFSLVLGGCVENGDPGFSLVLGGCVENGDPGFSLVLGGCVENGDPGFSLVLGGCVENEDLGFSLVLGGCNNTCFYGKCYYCRESEPACAEGEVMEGSVTLWLPDVWPLQKHRHPWGRTYREGKLARWEYDESYCDAVMKTAPYDSGPRLLDVIDTAIFDYLIGNADRHHYESFQDDAGASMLILLDNAKRVRVSTWNRLTLLRNGALSAAMRAATAHDPLHPILSEPHLSALDRRLESVLTTVRQCVETQGAESVLTEDRMKLSHS
ncbi:UNVERIFIED_CONTAM: hypothetical protein FKN15_044800 [Acipenser sinensis]